MSSQASYIAAVLFIGFVVFVTIRGELPAYKEAIFGSGDGGAAKPDSQTAAATALTPDTSAPLPNASAK